MVSDRRPKFSRGNLVDGRQLKHDIKRQLLVTHCQNDHSCVRMMLPKTCATIRFSTMSDQVNCFEGVQDKLALEEI
jgi:hypothetical protein